MFEPEELMARIIDLEAQLKVSEMAPPAAEQLIACLEGEIAKRDARIVELEYNYQDCNANKEAFASNAISLQESNTKLRAELAAIKAQEPVAEIALSDDGYKIGLLGALRNHRLPIGTKLYAAPVSEAKAKGVVMPERWNVPRPMWKDARQPYGNPLNHSDIEAAEKFNLALDEVARLNAAPVQRVSVPDGKVCVPVEVLRLYEFMAASFTPFTSQHEQIAISLRKAKAAMLASAPAAPAADAGLVEALKQAFPLFDEDGLNELYHHCEIAVLGDRKRLHKLLATHSAKGVV